MASLPMVFGAAASGGVFAATAAKGGGKEEKSLLDWVLGKITKQDQFYETDPILQRADDKEGDGTTSKGTTGNGRKGTTTVSGKKSTVSVQPKKKDGNGGVFGGLFAKK